MKYYIVGWQSISLIQFSVSVYVSTTFCGVVLDGSTRDVHVFASNWEPPIPHELHIFYQRYKFHHCGTYDGILPSTLTAIPCEDTTAIGEYIYIYIKQRTRLQLCEVQVYGTRMFVICSFLSSTGELMYFSCVFICGLILVCLCNNQSPAKHLNQPLCTIHWSQRCPIFIWDSYPGIVKYHFHMAPIKMQRVLLAYVFETVVCKIPATNRSALSILKSFTDTYLIVADRKLKGVWDDVHDVTKCVSILIVCH